MMLYRVKAIAYFNDGNLSAEIKMPWKAGESRDLTADQWAKCQASARPNTFEVEARVVPPPTKAEKKD